MPPRLALLGCIAFVVWLIREDNKFRPRCSAAIWIPLVWLLILGSRPVSWWFGVSISNSWDGNPVDRLVYLSLILASVVVVSKRGLVWGSLTRMNVGLTLFYAYLGLTMFWADESFVTFKRWFKELGAIPVMLILLTEKDGMAAVRTVFARCAYVLLPLSVVLVKYFPDLGRFNSPHGGEPMVTGVTFQKNSLGEIILVFGLALVWDIMDLLGRRRGRLTRPPVLGMLIVLGCGGWLLRTSDSKTAMICLALGTLVIVAHRLPWFKVHPGRVVFVTVVVLPAFVLLVKVLNLAEPVLRMLGRDPTLTNRTEIWDALKQYPVNPLLGSGYLMYWDIIGPLQLGEYEVSTLKTAHNGYLEIFLDGGGLGVACLVLMILAVGRRQIRALTAGLPLATLGFAYFLTGAVYNFSESIYARRSPLWFAFLLLAISFRQSWVPATEPAGTRPLAAEPA